MLKKLIKWVKNTGLWCALRHRWNHESEYFRFCTECDRYEELVYDFYTGKWHWEPRKGKVEP